MQKQQIDFLNHGILPFIGREREIERVERFWEETAQAHTLRAMLVVGEAGVGKSRLLEEVENRVSAAGGAVVHTRLYPDAATSIVPLLARAIGRSRVGQQVLGSEPEESVPGVARALGRLAGLRRTLLVIEDLHLLEQQAVGDLAAILSRLFDEPIAILFAARPGALHARAIIDGFLVDEIELHGLLPSEIAGLCETLFGERLAPETVAAVFERTTGNALALRSALRAGFRTATGGARGGASANELNEEAFVDALERNVRLLSEGMAAHLTEAERGAAESLAYLGEVFARETALELVSDGKLIDELIFKGVLILTPFSPPPLAGASSNQVLAFTHSLLHRHFVDGGSFDPAGIVRLLARGFAIHSYLPLHSLVDAPVPRSITTGEMVAATERLMSIALRSEKTSNWPQGDAVLLAARKLAEAVIGSLPPDEAHLLEFDLTKARLDMQRRERGDDYAMLVERIMQMTERVETEEDADRRIVALVYQRRLIWRNDLMESLSYFTEVEALLERFPRLRYGSHYLMHLAESARISLQIPDLAFRRRLEGLMNDVLDFPGLSDKLRRDARLTILAQLITTFDSEEELELRLRQGRELMEEQRPGGAMGGVRVTSLMALAARCDEAIELAGRLLPLLRDQWLMREIGSMNMHLFMARALKGEPLETLHEKLAAVIAEASEQEKQNLLPMVRYYIEVASALRGEFEWGRATADLYPLPSHNKLRVGRLYHAFHADDREALALPVLAEAETAQQTERLLAYYLDAEELTEKEVLDGAREYLGLVARTVDDAILIEFMFDYLRRVDSRKGTSYVKKLEPELRESVTRLASWFHERRIPVVLRSLLERSGELLDAAALKKWRARLTELEKENEEKGEGSVRLSMLSAVTVARPGEEPQRVRGAQLCTFLGALVADRLVEQRLSAVEFTAITIGGERDPEKARKSLNFAVFRLREMLGADAIVTGGETPELNLSVVDVDILRAHRHIEECERALSDGALVRALPEMLAALELAGGQVPFPALYDEFFEAAREEIESRLRGGTLRLARALLQEGDLAGAESILRRAHQAMPEDEEVIELLQGTLRSLGRRIEAARLGLKLTYGVEA